MRELVVNALEQIAFTELIFLAAGGAISQFSISIIIIVSIITVAIRTVVVIIAILILV